MSRAGCETEPPDTAALMEATMQDTRATQMDSPRIETGRPLLIAGLGESYTAETVHRIPAQWQRFAPYIGGIPGQIGHATYGVVSDAAHGIRYLTGVEVSGQLPLPGDLSQISIPAHRFAVFTPSGDVSTLHDTIDQIWRRWLPQSGHEAEPGAAFFERYGDDFDPRTGTGNVEIWVAVKE
jgi:AraC family transcriptional regulator